MSAEARFRRAFEQITTWMRGNGAAVLADNLASGATREVLDDAERALGFPIGDELRAMWSVHDGQREEMNGVVEIYDLLSSRLSVSDRENVTLPLEWMREESEPGDLSEDELASDAWVTFAARDSDGLAVCVASGRVFAIVHDDAPPLQPIADSLLAWLEAYAASVAADDYSVEEGFGDCHLSKRDRKREAIDAERLARQEAESARKAALSPAARIRDAVVRKDPDDARDFLEALEPPAFDAAVGALFVEADPAFVAGAIRTLLRRIELSPAQWRVVADGGAKLGNNAIVAFAKPRGG